MTVLVATVHGEAELREEAPADAHAVLSLRDWILQTPEAHGPVATAAVQDPARVAQRWATHMRAGFVAADAALLAVWDGHGDLPGFGWGNGQAGAHRARLPVGDFHPRGLYAIVESVPRLRQVLAAGIGLAQLRIKRPHDADAAWVAALRAQLRDGIAAAKDAGATLYVNDHWKLAAELEADAVHLGQEDLGRLGEQGRAELCGTGMSIGVSSHSVWELCRARTLAPAYIACGPVWPTTTKDMPWRPQGLDNLGWWCATAQHPVVAIGGILEPRQVRLAASAGASAVCLVRGLGDDPRSTVPAFKAAFGEGAAQHVAAPRLPHPSLEPRA